MVLAAQWVVSDALDKQGNVYTWLQNGGATTKYPHSSVTFLVILFVN